MSDKFFNKQIHSLQCKACARNCDISPNEVGFCGVRKNMAGELDLLNYGKVIFVKKQGNDLLVGFLGSNMRFSFDMDWDTSLLPYMKAKEINRKQANEFVKQVGYSFSPVELVDYAKRKKCEKIVFQFSEPLVCIEYVLDVSKQNGVEVGIVSNGYFSEEFFKFCLPHISSVDVLLYSMFEKFYFKHGRAQLSIIKENIFKLNEKKVLLKIVCPLIEGENDDQGNIENISKFVLDLNSNVVLVFKKYYPSYRMVDKGVTKNEVLEKSKEIALKIGVQNVILE